MTFSSASDRSQPPLIVAALGGNAISREDQEGNVDQQFQNSERTAQALAGLLEAGNRLVVTHGNGPQIGNFLLRNEAAAKAIYPLPMEVAAAHVQGGMGYMIAQTLSNELHRQGKLVPVVALITTVLVDRRDSAFENPTKPIGRTLTAKAAEQFARDEGWAMKEVSRGKFRRVVPSPAPREILELSAIRRSVDSGDVVVACGGGGIPVIRDEEGLLRGVRAVIDKDLAAALLAVELRASTLLILTSIDRVRIHFGTPREMALDSMTIDEAERHLNEGQFPPGSMGPKIQGALNFLRGVSDAGAKVIIGPLDQAADAVAGQTGTRIVRSR